MTHVICGWGIVEVVRMRYLRVTASWSHAACGAVKARFATSPHVAARRQLPANLLRRRSHAGFMKPDAEFAMATGNAADMTLVAPSVRGFLQFFA